MQDELDAPDIGDPYALVLGFEPAPNRHLRIGDAIVAPFAAKARVARFFTGLAAVLQRRKNALNARSMRTATFWSTCECTPDKVGRSALSAGKLIAWS
jgi:hypothetical protein